MTDPVDPQALRGMLDQMQSDRDKNVNAAWWEAHIDEDGVYRYGSETTYEELALAVLQVKEDIEGDMEIADDPVLIVQPGETHAACTMRINAEVDRRMVDDHRLLLLMHTHTPQVCSDAMERYRQYWLAMGDVLTTHGTKSFASPTVQDVTASKFGLNEFLPGHEV